MLHENHEKVLKRGAFQSTTKSYQYYSNKEVAEYVEGKISCFCRLCSDVFSNINLLKKHLNETHRRQYW